MVHHGLESPLGVRGLNEIPKVKRSSFRTMLLDESNLICSHTTGDATVIQEQKALMSLSSDGVVGVGLSFCVKNRTQATDLPGIR